MKTRTESRPELYGKEMETISLIKSGLIVEKLWRGLVGYANENILAKKRKEEPNNTGKWYIKFTDVKQGRLSEPISQITHMSYTVMLDYRAKRYNTNII